MAILTLARLATASSLTLLTGAGALLGFRLVRAEIAGDVYRERLGGMVEAYGELAQSYNRAVARTAVAELVVEDGELSVRVRTDAGTVREIETPFDPSGEIYVDYALLDGRLWIRRVFDERTPPRDGLVIDPELAAIDWEHENAAYGKAVYRSLPEGRWVVSVTGTGSLGLVRVEGDGPTQLAAPPEVDEFESVEADARAQAEAIGVGEVWARVFGDG